MNGDDFKSQRKLVLWILRNVGEIRGRTRFQKMVFLGQKKLGLPESFNFEMHYFGPYSWELTQTIESLKAAGYITERVRKSGDYTMYIYALSEQGKAAAKGRKMTTKRQDIKIKDAAFALDTLNQTPLSAILAYVYRNYSENPA
jgi:uncharacterized protein YwgA